MSRNVSKSGPRVLLRHDVALGCFEERHIVTGTVVGTYDYADGTGIWSLVELDEALPDGIWQASEAKVAAPFRQLLVIRSRWKGFEIGGRWPTSVDVCGAEVPTADIQPGKPPSRGSKLAECICFSESSFAVYADQLEGVWHGSRPIRQGNDESSSHDDV